MASYLAQVIEITRNHPVGVTVAAVSCLASAASYFAFSRNQCKVHLSSLAKPGLVVLHGMGPSCTIVNPSPFVLKLQTFLRMANIEYVHDLKHPFDKKHKMPWIELDGEVYGDSTFIIEFLTKRFNVKIDDHLDDEQKALARVISKTIEMNTFWAVILYHRFVEDFEWFRLNMKWTWSSSIFYKYIAVPSIKKYLYGHGIGRHSPQEIQQIARDDMMALSTLLGDKPFFLGNEPTTLDACVFGVIANVLRGLREDSWPNRMVKDEFPNLVTFSNRMKERYWPDWEKIIIKAD